MIMHKLAYFRTLYEYEKCSENLRKFKDYIFNNNQDVLKDLCSGTLYLPSPLLLDELTWSLDTQDERIKEIIYQLKITSRKFYNSLVEFEPGGYLVHFASTSTFLGQKMVDDIITIQLHHSSHKSMLLSNGLKAFTNKARSFVANYYDIFKGLYGILGLWVFLIGWLYTSLNMENAAVTLLLPATMSALISLAIHTLERYIHIFKNIDIIGNNLLARRYKEFITHANTQSLKSH